MIKKVEVGTDFFGDLLLLGAIDTYSGYLQYDEDRWREYDENDNPIEDSGISDDDYMEMVDSALKDWFEGFVFERYFKPLGFCKLHYVRLCRPKAYNYFGDHVEFVLDYDTNEFCSDFVGLATSIVEAAIEGKRESEHFEEFLSNFKSYDGFSSLTPSNLNDLLAGLRSGGKPDYNYDTYREENAFLAAWVYDSIKQGFIKQITLEDFLYSVVENIC